MKAGEVYLSTNEAAELLGVTRQRVIQLINRGRLKASKFANVYIIKQTDLKDVEDRAPGRPSKRSKSHKKSNGIEMLPSSTAK
jgi:excisionase family DNA binding protein